MAKKHKHEEHENLERWLVSYADFITLLFAFFTVLYALSMSDKAKYKNAVENIQKAFMSAGGIFPLRGSPFVPFTKPADRGSLIPPGPSDTGQFSKTQENEGGRAAEQIRSLFERTTGMGLNGGDVEVVKTDEGWKVRLGEVLLFKPGSDKIRRENVPFLFELGKRLALLGQPIHIEGHTDKVPAVSDHTNWQLSLSRAYNIVRFMVQAANFPQEKISLIGYGAAQPVADNETAEGRARNRRVEISIIVPNKAIETLDLNM